jgi:arylsulfatase A-like enzyme
MKSTRREFLNLSAKFIAATLLVGPVGLAAGSGCSSSSNSDAGSSSPAQAFTQSRPNILFLMMDQLHIPPEGYGPAQGVLPGIREILGFREISPGNPYTGFFPGFLRLRKNAVVLRTHYTASTACTPSRACIMTGQYNTGVTQTPGMFRSVNDTPWLDPAGVPTIGDWFRAAGYSTHYFGKWHVSNPQAPDYLEPWGFADWEKSYPEPHGGDSYNLGVYRDVGFVDNLVNFLGQQGAASSSSPWLAVGSLVNPHDCSSWPVNWQMPQNQGVVPWSQYPPPPLIPAMGEKSLPNPEGLQVALNPDGFPQENFFLPPTFQETLTDKPRCQYEYSLKYGLAIKSKAEVLEPYPFQLQGDSSTAWSLAYDQFYTYCTYLVDMQLRRILQALDDQNLAGTTVVVFLSDHGEMTGAHGGMIQKWHQAYEEIARVPMIVSSPLVNTSAQEMRILTQPTSSIDLAPTLLGLAGFTSSQVNELKASMSGQTPERAFAGADLAPFIKGQETGAIPGSMGIPRTGVLLASSDMITGLGPSPDATTQRQYNLFLASVEAARRQGYSLEPGPVRQPNNVRALCTGDWKLVRYIDPQGVAADEWELYHLETDPNETINIVNFRTGEVRSDVAVPGWTTAGLRVKNEQLKSDLAAQEALLLK